ncbi:MAG: esterase family protein [Eudoraea sp.]|nr:esterase family protein [Eudoraea sp.]
MFRTTSISDPQFESDHLRFITIKSRNLKGRGDIFLFVPPLGHLKNVPLVILLHGVYGSCWSWAYKGGVHLTAWHMMQAGEIPPMVIAMPSDGLWGDGSAYIPHTSKNFEKWIVEDVPKAVIENIDLVSETSKRYIGGLSMGGFGALRLGIKYSDLFTAVSAHSSITAIEQMQNFVEEPLTNYLQEEAHENSIIGIALNNKTKLPKIQFDCGLDDPLLEENRKLHQQMADNKIEHIYKEYPGGHEWSYWEKHVKESLLFFDSLV